MCSGFLCGGCWLRSILALNCTVSFIVDAGQCVLVNTFHRRILHVHTQSGRESRLIRDIEAPERSCKRRSEVTKDLVAECATTGHITTAANPLNALIHQWENKIQGKSRGVVGASNIIMQKQIWNGGYPTVVRVTDSRWHYVRTSKN